MRRLAGPAAIALVLSVVGSAVPQAYASAPPAPAARPRASTGVIVYVCGSNLCAVDPTTAKVKQLTRDGTEDSDYVGPGLSADGAVLAFGRDQDVYSGPVEGPYAKVATADDDIIRTSVSPDGQLIGYSYTYVSTYPYYTTNFGFMSSLTGPEGDGGDVTYLDKSGAVVVSRLNLDVASNYFGCVLRTPSDVDLDCATRLIDPDLNILDPAATSDGSQVATLTQDGDFTNGGIVTWDPVTGAKTATLLSTGVALAGLAYSPDAGQLTYTGSDNGIWVIPAAGGAPQRLTDGRSPTWGASTSTASVLPDARLRLKAAQLTKGRATVPVTCPWSCTVKARLTVSTKIRKRLGLSTTVVATGRARNPSGGTKKLTIKPSRKAAKALKRGFPATLRVTVRPVNVAGAQTIHASTPVKVTR